MYMILVLACTSHDNWDFYEELPGSIIPDQGLIGFGYRILPEPADATVKRFRICINIAHDVPSSLKIIMVREYYTLSDTLSDSLIIWDNDYPGNVQEVDLDHFTGVLVDADWDLTIHDKVVDGNVGELKNLALMIEYQ